MREEGAVGGSVAGSTAGWWPSDRDRFPPRFLLPPSLQTHNCIISTHLASSSSRFSPVSHPLFFFPSFLLSLSLAFPPSPSLSLLPPSASSPLTSLYDPTRCAPSRARFSLIFLSDQSTDRFSIPLFLPPFAVIHFVSSLLSHESHTRERGPPPSSFPAASLHGVDAMMLFSRSHHSATRVQQRLSLSLPLISRSERSCREFTSSFFLHYHLRLVLSSLFLRIS